MKKRIIFSLLLSSAMIMAQKGNVGVNTNTPTENLDVKGTVRVETLLEKGNTSSASNTTVTTSYNPTYLVTTDANGVLGKMSERIIASKTVSATKPIDVMVQKATAKTVTAIDLGLSTGNITIPKGKKCGIAVFYTVPIGVEVGSYELITAKINIPVVWEHKGPWNENISGDQYIPSNFNGYWGVTFFKNGTEEAAASRKVLAPARVADDVIQMTTVGASYFDEIDNKNGTTDIVVTYDAKGYIEPKFNDKRNYLTLPTGAKIRFNMYSATGANYNWGKANISYILYELP